MNRKRVLVGEDSSVIQNLTRNILQAQNYEIIAAKNGQQVLDILNKEEIDIILLDITMPVMDGVQCATTIRKMSDPKKANLPMIAITGNAKNYSPAEFDIMGFNEVLTKPLDYDKLVKVVNHYAGR